MAGANSSSVDEGERLKQKPWPTLKTSILELQHPKLLIGNKRLAALESQC